VRRGADTVHRGADIVRGPRDTRVRRGATRHRAPDTTKPPGRTEGFVRGGGVVWDGALLSLGRADPANRDAGRHRRSSGRPTTISTISSPANGPRTVANGSAYAFRCAIRPRDQIRTPATFPVADTVVTRTPDRERGAARWGRDAGATPTQTGGRRDRGRVPARPGARRRRDERAATQPGLRGRLARNVVPVLPVASTASVPP